MLKIYPLSLGVWKLVKAPRKREMLCKKCLCECERESICEREWFRLVVRFAQIRTLRIAVKPKTNRLPYLCSKCKLKVWSQRTTLYLEKSGYLEQNMSFCSLRGWTNATAHVFKQWLPNSFWHESGMGIHFYLACFSRSFLGGRLW